MSQPGAEQTPNNPQDPGTPAPPTPSPQTPPVQVQVTPGESEETFGRDYVEQLRREAAAARTANKTLQKRIDDAARANMTETEQAIVKAREEAAAEVRKTYASRLATSEFRTQAVAAGISTEQLPALLEDLAVDKFVTDDGEPDLKRITTKVRSWASLAAPEPRRQSFDGGPRQTNTAQSMDDLIRGQLGITR
jgi:hypothetical protein